jgi:hypothetical protein
LVGLKCLTFQSPTFLPEEKQNWKPETDYVKILAVERMAGGRVRLNRQCTPQTTGPHAQNQIAPTKLTHALYNKVIKGNLQKKRNII